MTPPFFEKQRAQDLLIKEIFEAIKEKKIPLSSSYQQKYWSTWEPTSQTVLCFIREGDQLLLIEKKRGLGAGKINAPGGHLNPKETPLEAAIRETEEEIGVTPLQLKEVGHLYFQFIDQVTLLPQKSEDNISQSMKTTVFLAEGFLGSLRETEEALPFWNALDSLPFDQMWEDDRYWIPQMLSGQKFSGFFFFDQDKMLTQELFFNDKKIPFIEEKQL